MESLRLLLQQNRSRASFLRQDFLLPVLFSPKLRHFHLSENMFSAILGNDKKILHPTADPSNLPNGKNWVILILMIR
jgi:hypothetical protein